MSDPFAAAVGQSVSCAKTVGESDVYLFAGITGDLSPNHVDEAAMAKTAYGHRIAHGALLVGYMSRASTMICDRCGPLMEGHFPVSLGYDKVRFLNAVLIGDTITVKYTIVAADTSKLRTMADVEVRNQSGTLCAVASHIMRWIARG
ncbi:MaoC family dehydratase [Aestuariivirga sp.]|uniref:MaoC family dehydratase n=1 Tax=Aestuariivirga sp. TaxID=2650926 RepID=UPI0035938A90